MTEEGKEILSIYKEEFENYKNFIDLNYWFDDVKFNKSKNKLESSKLQTEVSIISTIIKGIEKFKEDIKEDINSKKTTDFLKFTSDIIERHINTIAEYKKLFPIHVNSSESDVEFHSDLFALITKTKISLSKLNINESDKKDKDIFFGNARAPLVMREQLCSEIPIVKDMTDLLGINFNSPTINPSTSNELLINMKDKDIPPYNPKKHFFDQEVSTIQFWEEEFNKIKNGVNIGGYHISNWLYWHINIFKLAYGKGKDKSIKIAEFRDNEYFFDHMYNKAASDEYGRHAVFSYGSRRFAKSVGMTSRLLHGLWTINNAQGTVQGFSKIPDLLAIINYSSDAILNMFPALRVNANSIDIDQGISLGIKGKKAQDIYKFGELTVVNLEGGTTKRGSQKAAAFTPDIFLLDEAGKGKCIPIWKAAMPSFAGGENGKWRLVPLISGCVCAGTKVYDKNGNVVNIEDITKETGILGYNGSDYSVENIPWIQPPKEKECVRITTDYNKSIECSHDHPLMVYGNNGVFFKRAENITKKDKLIFFNGNKPFGKKRIYHAELIGLVIGDGYYGQGCELSISDKSLYDYIKEKYYWHIDDKEPDCIKPYYRRTTIKGFTHVLEYHGMYGDTKMNKKLPVDINDWDEDSVAQLLRGYFEADGYISKEVNRRRITLTSVSLSLINEVQKQLEKFGIISNVFPRIRNSNKRVIIKSNINNKEGFINSSDVCYNLEITRYEFIEKFADKIGFISEYKKTRLENSIKGYQSKVKKLNKVPFKDLLPEKGQYFIGKNCENISFVSVKTNESIGLKPIYNLEAGITHTYITNGFVSHNTAGEGELSIDAELMLKNPEMYSILPMDWDFLEEFVDPEFVTWKRNNFGFFVPAQMSLEAPDKIKKPFGDFLKSGNIILDDETHLELNNINISVTDWEKSMLFFNEKREKLSKDITLLSGEINSFPLDPEDCYATTEVNIFPGQECKRRKSIISENGMNGQKYRIHSLNGEIFAEMSPNDKTITEYPYKGTSIDCPVILMENPLLSDSKPPLGLYVIGFDDVKHDKTDGDSVMSATIFKRGYEGGEWANRIVGTYDSRPERKKDYYKVLYLLIKMFNARFLHENADNGFIEYLEENHPEDLYTHVSAGVGLASEDNLHRNNNRKWGWHPTDHNIYHLNQKIVRYTKEEGVVIGEEQGLSGVDRINAEMLLEELYRYKKGKNADRIRSFGLALTLASYYDRTYQYIKNRKKTTTENKKNKQDRYKTYKGLTSTKGFKKY